MLNTGKKVYLLLFFAFAVVFSTTAQTPLLHLGGGHQMPNYAQRSYSTNDGLPSKSVTCALRSKTGIMWLGTANGLCRFDGYSFKVFVSRSGNLQGLSNNFINSLAEDQDGNIWIGTMDGLCILEPKEEKFRSFRHDARNAQSISNDKIWSVLCDRNNNIWVGTDDGFNQYERKNDEFLVYRPDAKNSNAMVGKSVNSIIEGEGPDLWLGNWGGGLTRFNRSSKVFRSFKQEWKAGSKNPNDVWSVVWGKDKTLWVSTYWKGLYNFNPRTQQFKYFGGPDADNPSVFSAVAVSNEKLLVGGTAGIFWLNIATNKWIKVNDGTFYANGEIYDDRAGRFWLCTNSGLIKLDTNQYKFNFASFNIGQKAVKALLEQDSLLWLGTNNGLYQFDLRTGQTTEFRYNGNSRAISSNDISKLYIDSKKQLWVLTENGFDLYNKNNRTFTNFTHHSKLGSLFNEDVFRDMIELTPGKYLLATDAGLKTFNSANQTFEHYYNQPNNPNSISNNHLYCLSKDLDGTIWIGTAGGGVNRFDPATKTFRRYLRKDNSKGDISDNTINNIFRDSRGGIWICTVNGLNRYDRKQDNFISYSNNNGFASNEFNNICEDAEGKLWVLTGTGLSRFDPVNLEVKNFDEADGAFVSDRIAKGPGGLMLVAGPSGILYFSPAQIKLNAQKPPVYLTDLQIFNRSVVPGVGSVLKKYGINAADEIRLSHGQNMFSVEFSALNYTNSEKNNYAYKLLGFDKKWNYVGNQRKATYTNLNPGRYTLKVKAANNDGYWNEAGKEIKIIITPAWYATWWAYSIYLLIIAGLVTVFVFYKSRQAKLQYRIKVANIESEKEKELSEKKLSFFTNISHEFRTPLTLIINPVKELLYKNDQNIDTTSLNIVYRNARRLLGLVDQLLLFRKAGDDDELRVSMVNIVELTKEVFLCFTHQARVKNIQYDFHSPDSPIEVLLDREKVEIVLFNLLSNAVKFTPPHGRIEVKVSESENTAIIQVSDTGRGIPASIGEKLYNRFYQEPHQSNAPMGGFGIGLYLVKTFIERHKGKVTYESELGAGTVFKVELLKGKEHLDKAQIVEDTASSSVLLREMIDDEVTVNASVEAATEPDLMQPLASDSKTILVVDDNDEIREYIKLIFKLDHQVLEAADGETGLNLVKETMPDIVISDVMMPGMSGIELCNLIKDDASISHIPVILLTASSSPEIKLKGIEGGADDYISKPFDRDLLKARVSSILKSRNTLQQYFYNEITLSPGNLKISNEYKQFLDLCIKVVEKHLQDADFSILVLAQELGISKSNLNNRVKSISGLSPNNFIRFIRLRKAAELFINTNNTIMETAYQVGINDAKYFREQFSKLFNMNPSQYIKKYRNPAFYQNTVSPALRQAKK
ncbi:two-component regulator propeller domain-containing protein [Mucilaginibacter terrae]|uniref:histidine kinase n=1 Tax=Mucilaginibacter terrae TaxID=1955052 RepID=A0ABU3H0B8_9SPHI|nr:two-component regulator propeller domain-containing protein [Mucilaginibacter terrae]MDT3405466.1 signal transduction histidine kinase/ligand-binding sensor domain-containing protein/DNA-binding response OmpR family regulator [Mucilaginibacter terrae]